MHRLVLLVSVLAACGDDGVRHTPDASTHDAPASDGAPDSASQPVTLTVTIAGAPAPGVHAYFLDADSTVVLATTTDATGSASAVMAAGGSVTAIDPFATGPTSNHDVETFLAVKPGDHLLLAQPGETMATTVTVTAPIDTAAGVVSYEVHTPCGYGNLVDPGSGASPSAQLDLYACGASTDFYVVTRDQNGQIVDYLFKPGVAVSANATIDLTAQAYTAGSTRTVTITNLPAQSEVGFQDALVGPTSTFLVQYGSAVDGSPQPVSTVGIGTHVVTTQAYVSPANHMFFDWAPYSTTYTLDVAARSLAPLTGYPTVDNASRSIALAEDAGGVAPEFLVTSVAAVRNSDSTAWLWRVAAPHATTVALPHLPTDVYDFNFQVDDETFSNGVLVGKVPGGYDAVRPFLLSSNFQNVSDLTTSATGTATLEVVQGKGPI